MPCDKPKIVKCITEKTVKESIRQDTYPTAAMYNDESGYNSYETYWGKTPLVYEIGKRKGKEERGQKKKTELTKNRLAQAVITALRR
jgi:hypothetical protein